VAVDFGDPAEAAEFSTFLDSLITPMQATEFEARKRRFAAAIARFQGEGVIQAGPTASTQAPLATKPILGNIVWGICGAIHAVNVAPEVQVVARLAKSVDLVLTREACRFIRWQSFEHLGLRVWNDLHRSHGKSGVPHIDLARNAELIVVYPATAHTLYKMAHGACSDLLSLILTATRAPVVVFPSMNDRMWASPSVQRNVARVREDGVYVASPGASYNAADGPTGRLTFGGAGLGANSIVRVISAVLSFAREATG
jgi:phosphopantothenoylcysteine decarboxylase / phosphopantothenate---cysteine ligase